MNHHAQLFVKARGTQENPRDSLRREDTINSITQNTSRRATWSTKLIANGTTAASDGGTAAVERAEEWPST